MTTDSTTRCRSTTVHSRDREEAEPDAAKALLWISSAPVEQGGDEIDQGQDRRECEEGREISRQRLGTEEPDRWCPQGEGGNGQRLEGRRRRDVSKDRCEEIDPEGERVSFKRKDRP